MQIWRYQNYNNLVEIRQLCDLVPQILHDLLVCLELRVVPLALGLDDRVPHRQALKVVLVQEAVVVDVVHVAHDELDAVVPRVSHLDAGLEQQDQTALKWYELGFLFLV